MNQRDTPFWHGQQAFNDGVGAMKNPHDKNASFEPDDWPGDHRNWRDGWVHARHVKRFNDASTHSVNHNFDASTGGTPDAKP